MITIATNVVNGESESSLKFHETAGLLTPFRSPVGMTFPVRTSPANDLLDRTFVPGCRGLR